RPVVVWIAAVYEGFEGQPIAYLGDSGQDVAAVCGWAAGMGEATHMIVVEVGQEHIIDGFIIQGLRNMLYVSGDPLAGAAAPVGLEIQLVDSGLAGVAQHGSVIEKYRKEAFALAGINVVKIEVTRRPVREYIACLRLCKGSEGKDR